MSGFEFAGAIMAIVSGFATAVNSYGNWRERRRRKKERDGERGLDDDEKGLGISLFRGRRDVRKAYDKGVAGLGREFQRGDEVGISQLQAQVIRLQGTIITMLGKMVKSGSPLDDAVHQSLADLFAASEQTRNETVRAMKDQYQRLSMKKPIKRGPSMAQRWVLTRPWQNDTITNESRGDECMLAHVRLSRGGLDGHQGRQRKLSKKKSTIDIGDFDLDSDSDDPASLREERVATPQADLEPLSIVPPPSKSYGVNNYESGQYCPFARELQENPALRAPANRVNKLGFKTKERKSRSRHRIWNPWPPFRSADPLRLQGPAAEQRTGLRPAHGGYYPVMAKDEPPQTLSPGP
ncbi:hypothetical protein VTJ04DRAFT_9925 [Mycothermus thermophilus]|uniref:uncharacterized protein n=1 Tax=Humicola insolens TaxID=85995 RepID=UPI0037445FE3